MSKNNSGFSSLVSLVSQIDSDDQFNERIRTAITANTETVTEDIINESKTNDVAHATSVDSPSQSKKTPNKPGSSLLRNLVALVVIIGGFIWWTVTNNNKDLISPVSYSNEPVISTGKVNQKPEDTFASQENNPSVKPRVGNNNIITVPEIKWCLSEKGRLKLLRQSLISGTSTSANKYIDFNDLILDFNKRCAEYRYKEYDYNLATWQIKNGTKRTSCYDDNIETGNEKFKNNDIVTSISFYKKAYSCATSQQQKIVTLGSLAEAEFRNDSIDQSRVYIKELLSLSPQNKWASDFVNKLDTLNKGGLEQSKNNPQKSLSLDKKNTSAPINTQENNKKLTKQIQERLSQLGYKPGYADGIYGQNTENAIKQFQRESGLDVNGKVTEKLFLLLKRRKLKKEQQNKPKKTNLNTITNKEKREIENACQGIKLVNGPAAFYKCVQGKVKELSGARRPNYDGVNNKEKREIEDACQGIKLVNGPAAFYKCVQGKVKELSGARRPNYDGVNNKEKREIEDACQGIKLVNGPAAFYKCVQGKVKELSGARRPNYDGVNNKEKREIENACQGIKLVNGPAAFYKCVQNKINQLL